MKKLRIELFYLLLTITMVIQNYYIKKRNWEVVEKYSKFRKDYILIRLHKLLKMDSK